MALVERQGFDITDIRQRVFGCVNGLGDPDVVSLEQAFDAISDLVSLADWRHPGVTIGRIIASELTCMHLKLASSVSTVGEWLALIPPTESLIGDLGSLRVDITDTATEFSWTMSRPNHPAASLVCEAMLVATARNIDDVTVAHCPPMGAVLGRFPVHGDNAMKSGATHKSVLECELRCSVALVNDTTNNNTALRYGPDLLNRATHQISGQLPFDSHMLQVDVDDIALQDTFVIDTSQAILAQLEINGACIEAVASQLALSTRTLQRRLGDRGLSYTRLVTALRQSRSKYLLLNSELSIDQIAAQLGYDRANAFGAAFRRWWGESPARYRRLHVRQEEILH